MSSTNAYGELLNPLYPSYPDKDEELEELMRFFKFSYQKSSGYQGTGVFEIHDNDDTYFITVITDPADGVQVSRNVPDANEISFYCTLPYKTFHDAFWGEMTIKSLVLGGGCHFNGWLEMKSAYNFGISFDMSSKNWVEYYKSGLSLKRMRNDFEQNNIMQSIGSFEHRSIGAPLPFSADCTDFMYQWKPIKGDDEQRECLLKESKIEKFEPLMCAKNVTERFRKNLMDEYIGWHSQYARNKIGSVSLSFFNDSVHKFTSFIHQRVVDNEGAHFSFLNAMFG